jgi:hypothetical protein
LGGELSVAARGSSGASKVRIIGCARSAKNPCHVVPIARLGKSAAAPPASRSGTRPRECRLRKEGTRAPAARSCTTNGRPSAPVRRLLSLGPLFHGSRCRSEGRAILHLRPWFAVRCLRREPPEMADYGFAYLPVHRYFAVTLDVIDAITPAAVLNSSSRVVIRWRRASHAKSV